MSKRRRLSMPRRPSSIIDVAIYNGQNNQISLPSAGVVNKRPIKLSLVIAQTMLIASGAYHRHEEQCYYIEPLSRRSQAPGCRHGTIRRDYAWRRLMPFEDELVIDDDIYR